MKRSTKIVILILGSIGYGILDSVLQNDIHLESVVAYAFVPVIGAIIVTVMYETIRGIIKKKFFEKSFIDNLYLAWSTLIMVLLIFKVITALSR